MLNSTIIKASWLEIDSASRIASQRSFESSVCLDWKDGLLFVGLAETVAEIAADGLTGGVASCAAGVIFEGEVFLLQLI
jgi:hypothetical protein